MFFRAAAREEPLLLPALFLPPLLLPALLAPEPEPPLFFGVRAVEVGCFFAAVPLREEEDLLCAM